MVFNMSTTSVHPACDVRSIKYLYIQHHGRLTNIHKVEFERNLKWKSPSSTFLRWAIFEVRPHSYLLLSFSRLTQIVRFNTMAMRASSHQTIKSFFSTSIINFIIFVLPLLGFLLNLKEIIGIFAPKKWAELLRRRICKRNFVYWIWLKSIFRFMFSIWIFIIDRKSAFKNHLRCGNKHVFIAINFKELRIVLFANKRKWFFFLFVRFIEDIMFVCL